jgi:DNA-binding Xre family transcriptional regulator
MSELQKNNITKLLKEKGKSKRELAHFLEIHENGINRMLSNPDIRLKRLEQIAKFLDIDVSILIKVVYSSKPRAVPAETDFSLDEIPDFNLSEYDRVNDSEINEELVLKLSELIKGQKIIGDMLRRNSEVLTEITDLLIKPANK